ncbi:MAG TPA: site-2 protease family protein [Candidatus Limnocylindria bacterium]|nr:site-2 protease family protein [Candidatus Limnocylindria bacterium]
MLVLFACVVIHEAGHALVARRYGIGVSEIVLFAFGGVSRLERDPAEPGAAARVALAGPATSLVLAAIFAAFAAVLPRQSAFEQASSYLAAINAALAIFNLLPAYPLDGGRVVHALVWKLTGNHTRATRFAGTLTTLIGYLAAVGGVLLFFRGALVQGVWIELLAWYVVSSARAEWQSEVVFTPLKGVRCEALADPPGEALQPDMTCESALREMVKSRRRVLPVALDGRFLGLVTLPDFATLDGRDPQSVYVTAIMTRLDDLVTVAPDVSALDALKRLSESGHHQLPVVEDDRLIGFISEGTLARAVAFAEEQGTMFRAPSVTSRGAT